MPIPSQNLMPMPMPIQIRIPNLRLMLMQKPMQKPSWNRCCSHHHLSHFHPAAQPGSEVRRRGQEGPRSERE